MCGISALFPSSSGCEIRQMTDIIRHRGPDDEGYLLFSSDGSQRCFGGSDTPSQVYGSELPYTPNEPLDGLGAEGVVAALGHRRLTIVDLSPTGHQPLCTPDRRYWITYNGEVYNYLELRGELTAKGYTFYSQSDTEVILAAYREWGEQALHRFNGMFAFVIFDTKTRRVFAARDRFAIKPLYYWIAPDGLVAIASEIKQFTTLNGWRAALNHQMAYEFLHWGMTDHTRETLFRGVQQLQGGESLSFSIGEEPRVRRWYDLPIGSYEGSLAQAGEEFRELLEDSVRLRLRADVPVGSCLSGGLDSSSIVCLANQLLREKSSSASQATFSACSHEKRFDERPFMEEVVSKTGVRPHYLYPTLEALFDELETISWHQEQPFGSTSIYAQWKVFQEVRKQNVKVMLDGQGADEQLAGYDSFFIPFLYDMFRGGHWFGGFREARAIRKSRPGTQSLLKLIPYALPDRMRQQIRRLARRPSAASTWIETDRLSLTHRDPHLIDVPQDSALNRLCYAQITRTNIPMLLRFEDRNSMAHSVEARTPFLDYRLVEFTQRLPPDYKIRKGLTKAVMRQGLRHVLPPVICHRTCKLGFATPEEVWVREEQPDRFQAAVCRAVTHSQGILGERALQLADRTIRGSGSFDYTPWRMISFGSWMSRFRVSVD